MLTDLHHYLVYDPGAVSVSRWVPGAVGYGVRGWDRAGAGHAARAGRAGPRGPRLLGMGAGPLAGGDRPGGSAEHRGVVPVAGTVGSAFDDPRAPGSAGSCASVLIHPDRSA